MIFRRVEPLPLRVNCAIHSHEDAFWHVTDHPYSTISGVDGSYEIPLIPYGTYEFTVWHEETGYLDRFTAKIDAKEVKRPTVTMSRKSLRRFHAKPKPSSEE